MKSILLSFIILFLSFYSLGEDLCDNLKFTVEVSDTSQGLNNGEIKVVLKNKSSHVKAFLYGDKKAKNKLDISIDELTQLKPGSYILILQNKDCSSVKRDIIIK